MSLLAMMVMALVVIMDLWELVVTFFTIVEVILYT